MRVVALLSALAFASVLSAQTVVDRIVDRAVQARGGLERIKAIRSQRLSGRIAFSGESQGPFTVSIRRPSSIREEFSVGGEKLVRVSDGTTAWVRSGESEATTLPASDVKTMAASADIEGPLVDYKAKGHEIEFGGMLKLNGRDNFKLIVKQKDGQTRSLYIDRLTYLEYKWEGTVLTDGREFPVESYFSDYRRVDGIMCAFRIDSITIGTPVKQRIAFDNIEINVPLDGALFAKPQ